MAHADNDSDSIFVYCVCAQALQQAGLKGAECVVLGTGPGHPTDAEADAHVLASLLQVRADWTP
jgi:hypothetical protein